MGTSTSQRNNERPLTPLKRVENLNVVEKTSQNEEKNTFNEDNNLIDLLNLLSKKDADVSCLFPHFTVLKKHIHTLIDTFSDSNYLNIPLENDVSPQNIPQ